MRPGGRSIGPRIPHGRADRPRPARGPQEPAAGSQTRNTLPMPGVLSTVMLPPCASTSPRVMYRPSPSPRYGFARLARLEVAVEQVRQLIRGNPRSTVLDRENGPIGCCTDDEPDRRTGGGVLARVFEQVRDDLLDPHGVGRDRPWLPDDLDGHRMCSEHVLDLADERRHELGKIDLAPLQEQPLRVDPRRIQEVAGDPLQPVPAPLHHLERGNRNGRGVAARLSQQHVHLQHHGLERRPKVMGDDRGKVLAQALELLPRGDVLVHDDDPEPHPGWRVHRRSAQSARGTSRRHAAR